MAQNPVGWPCSRTKNIFMLGSCITHNKENELATLGMDVGGQKCQLVEKKSESLNLSSEMMTRKLKDIRLSCSKLLIRERIVMLSTGCEKTRECVWQTHRKLDPVS